MNLLVSWSFLAIFFADYAVELKLMPQAFSWTTDLFALLFLVIIAVRVAEQKTLFINKIYLLYLFVLLGSIVIGISLNSTSVNALFKGMRVHLRFIPFFFLAAGYDFSPQDFGKQMRLLLALLAIQTPLALFQRLVQFRHVPSGDYVSGTLGISSILSITLINAISILFVFYLKRRISLKLFLPLALWLFIPPMINGTKGTFLLLPLAFIVTLFLHETTFLKKLQVVVVTACVGGFFLFAFVVVHNYVDLRYSSIGKSSTFAKKREERNILSFFSDKEMLTKYLYKGIEGKREDQQLGKLDSVRLAHTKLSEEPFQYMFGLGIGNTLPSKFSLLQGGRAREAEAAGAGMTTLSFELWEIGILGFLLLLLFLGTLFFDACRLRSSDSVWGSLGMGWAAVVAVMLASILYKNYIMKDIVLLFWFFSGMVANKSWKLKVES